MIFLLPDTYSKDYNVVNSRSLSGRGRIELLSNGDVVMLDPMISYACHQIHLVGFKYRTIVPQFEKHIRRALRECAFDFGIFARQRFRFLVFEYFVRFVVRYLVANAITMSPSDIWSRYDEIFQLEKRATNDWHEWFADEGLHIDSNLLDFAAETQRHFKVLKDIVQELDVD